MKQDKINRNKNKATGVKYKGKNSNKTSVEKKSISKKAEPKKANIITTTEPERIAKYLARAGVASRREVEKLIAEGKISVNGDVINSPVCFVSGKDKIIVDGKKVEGKEATRLWIFNKPKGYVVSNKDPEGRPTIFEILPKDLPRVISIGRLDINTEGLLLLTNDGEFARKMELPSSNFIRIYRVRGYGRLSENKLLSLKDGVEIEGVKYKPIKAEISSKKGDNYWIEMAIYEGKNREVKKVLEYCGLQVNRLIRTQFGDYELGELETGKIYEADLSGF